MFCMMIFSRNGSGVVVRGAVSFRTAHVAPADDAPPTVLPQSRPRRPMLLSIIMTSRSSITTIKVEY